MKEKKSDKGEKKNVFKKILGGLLVVIGFIPFLISTAKSTLPFERDE